MPNRHVNAFNWHIAFISQIRYVGKHSLDTQQDYELKVNMKEGYERDYNSH